MDQLCKLGWLASEILLKGTNLLSEYAAEEIGMVITNAHSSLDTDIRYYNTIKEAASPALFVYTLPNILLGEISIRNGFKGENGCFIFPHFDGGFLEDYTGYLLDSIGLKACICGWVDVLEDHYEAVLFLAAVTNGSNPGALPFTKENMENIYRQIRQEK